MTRIEIRNIRPIPAYAGMKFVINGDFPYPESSKCE